MLVIDLGVTASRLERHNSNVKDVVNGRVFESAATNLVLSDSNNTAVTLVENVDGSLRLEGAVGNFTTVPAKNAINVLQDSLRLHTQDRFDHVLKEILKIWTVRAHTCACVSE